MKDTIYVLGSGAIGFPLAAYLAHAGRRVVAVRTSRNDVPKSMLTITVRSRTVGISVPVETISLCRLTRLQGTIVIAAKSHANKAIAPALKERMAISPLVIMQNGIGVERPFLDARFSPVYRCVLYITSQVESEYHFTVRPVAPSPVGVVEGSDAHLEKCVEALTTEGFPFRAEANIHREIWKKAIANAVFNSICPLLEVDNGVFERDAGAARLVRECVAVTDLLNMGLSESELMEQIMRISRASDGQFISTLQDIRAGRQTEMEFLNLGIARVAAALRPPLELPRIELLVNMILAKSLGRRPRPLQPRGDDDSGVTRSAL
jgi:2-dehydropantoate 2-reductase